ncbi:hypothetical protein [Sphingobium sp. KCTC 72723]|uniref:hypothetical protein n=1 Tax=Sphingobium sp. KCTC 72723 TaxID=2733867 RepID=UPI00165E5F75|nr:hypothetical protein [Sphingobium sp. KCTC 72723]
MSGSYRYIILAAFGWLILAASPEKQAADRNQADAQNASTEALRNIATAIEQANERPEPDAGCEAGKDNRQSDLCAQWKAADAAKDSADWTRRTFWLGCVGAVIGAATLIAAGFAAWYAKKAAIETEKGAMAALNAVVETRKSNEIAEKAIRPWVFVEVVDTNATKWMSEGWPFEFGFKLTNFGASPAIIDKILCQVVAYDIVPPMPGHFYPNPTNEQKLYRSRIHKFNEKLRDTLVLPPSAESRKFSDSGNRAMVINDKTPEPYRSQRETFLMLISMNDYSHFLYGNVVYRDVNNIIHETGFCFRHSFSHDWITEEGGNDYNYRT